MIVSLTYYKLRLRGFVNISKYCKKVFYNAILKLGVKTIILVVGMHKDLS